MTSARRRPAPRPEVEGAGRAAWGGHRRRKRSGNIVAIARGSAIQRAAAESGVKDVTLELGGKNAMVVFGDADLDAAAEGAVFGMNFTWSGQSCG
jgi:hypothetical protein